MARPTLPDISPWRRRPLTIPPNSLHAWLQLATWEVWIGLLMGGSLAFGTRLIATARDATMPLYLLFNVWSGGLMFLVAIWLAWELWNAVAPKPITDDFLTLLDDSFGRDWRRPRTWPWTRAAWAYGFTLVGACLALIVALSLP